jgi:type IV secretory pathway TrbD component
VLYMGCEPIVAICLGMFVIEMVWVISTWVTIGVGVVGGSAGFWAARRLAAYDPNFLSVWARALWFRPRYSARRRTCG